MERTKVIVSVRVHSKKESIIKYPYWIQGLDLYVMQIVTST